MWIPTSLLLHQPRRDPGLLINGSFTLTNKERDVLLSPREWLSDTIINASQVLLKEGSGMHGFQETTNTVNFLINAPGKKNSNSHLALYKTKINLNVLGWRYY